jgi:hypothetical protein
MSTQKKQFVVRAALLVAVLSIHSVAFAQHEGKGQWHAFGAVGGWTGIGGVQTGAGIGGERLLFKGLAIGFDVQGFGTRRYRENYGGVVLTTNGSYHFKNITSSGKVVPFGTAGLSSIALCGDGCGGTGGFNVGGGVNYWFKPNRGLRLEVRDHVLVEYGPMHKWETRIGFSF